MCTISRDEQPPAFYTHCVSHGVNLMTQTYWSSFVCISFTDLNWASFFFVSSRKILAVLTEGMNKASIIQFWVLRDNVFKKVKLLKSSASSQGFFLCPIQVELTAHDTIQSVLQRMKKMLKKPIYSSLGIKCSKPVFNFNIVLVMFSLQFLFPKCKTRLQFLKKSSHFEAHLYTLKTKQM